MYQEVKPSTDVLLYLWIKCSYIHVVAMAIHDQLLNCHGMIIYRAQNNGLSQVIYD